MSSVHDGDSGLVITTRDIWDKLVALEEKITVVAQVPDHEKRLRTLERWAWGIPSGFVLGLASIIVTLKGR